MPTTKWGKGAVGSLGVFWVLMALLQLMVASGQTGGNSFFDNWYLAGTALAIGVSGIICLVAGLVAVVKHKERSVLGWATVIWGLVVVYFIVGEILGPD